MSKSTKKNVSETATPETTERKKRIEKIEQTVDVAGTSVTVPLYQIERNGEKHLFGSHKEVGEFLKATKQAGVTKRIKSMYEKFGETDISSMTDEEQTAFQSIVDAMSDYLEVAR